MSPREPVTFDRMLDWVVIIVGSASLVMIAYDLNLSTLGRRLAAETQAWLREQRYPTPPPKKEEP